MTRAVHLNIVPDFSTETFIQCLKGLLPDEDYQGRLSRTMVKHLQQQLKHEDVQAYTSGVNVESTMVGRVCQKMVAKDDWPGQVHS